MEKVTGGLGSLYQNIIKDSKGQYLFREFLKQLGSSAPLDFCLETAKFKTSTDEVDRQRVALEVSASNK